ncbi:hypothetical protein TanjilG_09850 [Lupinus angustifolius]|uniref:Protein BIG GRAIN 1-like B n=1 Tax=Lupinus angustifolius TaxID=3871 RepID=A0A4P1QWI5_LUPAN|nr:PREDICTED: protein BIG GRAIN 1-like B [Lupinus angustifolius]OIV96423.1 hypothetical protein TanjilG_09850 [Lupinus angustifolius]
MHSFDNNRFINFDEKNPSFSSTLLDKIYRSIDEGERKSSDMKFYRETTTVRKQSRSNVKFIRASDKVDIQGRQHNISQMHHHRVHDHERDVMFFSSVSNSSDSSSGTLSSSDTESLYGMRSKASCFVPYPKPKPVRTNVSEKTEKKITERKHSNMFLEQKKNAQIFDSYSNIESSEEGLIKSKSRAMKIYNNLKKVKQPISPGGKLTNFLNKLFATGNNTKKPKSTSSVEDTNAERKTQAGSTCSSASSFSRSCLSKTSPSSREKLRNNGVKRTVRFYPVSVIVDEDSRPCGHKSLYEEKELQFQQNKSNFHPTGIDDDAASDSSSDLFELDHLTVFGNDDRYFEELPVYETTHLSTNRAIVNGRIM